MGIDLLVKKIKETLIPYAGDPIIHYEKYEQEINVSFGKSKDMAENMFNLCDYVEAAFQKNSIKFSVSRDKAGEETDFRILVCWCSYPDGLYLGGRKEEETEKAACSVKAAGDNVLISIEDEDASVAGYTPRELFEAVYACIERLKDEYLNKKC